MISYTVRCTFTNSDIAQPWLEWLAQEHVQDVIDAGAIEAEIFELEDGRTYEIRYQFSSRSEFEAYEREHAPRLRQEGLNKFPLELGLSYSRTVGEQVKQFKAAH